MTASVLLYLSQFIVIPATEWKMNERNKYYNTKNRPLYRPLYASFHNNACGIAFADGHSEIHKWRDGATCPPVQYITWTSVGASTYNDPDFAWFEAHTGEPP